MTISIIRGTDTVTPLCVHGEANRVLTGQYRCAVNVTV